MHADFTVGETMVMASDGMATGSPDFKGFSLAITCANEREADRVFEALGDGGKVEQPLTKTFFSPRFGMVADKFGVSWMVVVPPPQQNASR
jgi:PhnB protein